MRYNLGLIRPAELPLVWLPTRPVLGHPRIDDHSDRAKRIAHRIEGGASA